MEENDVVREALLREALRRAERERDEAALEAAAKIERLRIEIEERRRFEIDLIERRNEAMSVLVELVRLKDGPRDEAYRAAKDAAWEAARGIIKREGQA